MTTQDPEFDDFGGTLQGSPPGGRSGGMTTLRPYAIALVVAATTLACAPKKDTANPDKAGSCTEEAKVCEDGTTVVREGPDCEFAACPGEADALAADGADADADADQADADADVEADADADADEEDAE